MEFYRGQTSEKCIERAESLTETLATQASRNLASINVLRFPTRSNNGIRIPFAITGFLKLRKTLKPVNRTSPFSIDLLRFHSNFSPNWKNVGTSCCFGRKSDKIK